MNLPKDWIAQRYMNWRIARLAKVLAASTYPVVWQDVRRKLNRPASEIAAYTTVRAAQQVHARVDGMLENDSALSPIAASQLISLATQLVVKKILATVPKQPRKSGRSRLAG